MPLSEQCIADLNRLMNHMRMVGVKYMNARRAFQKSGEAGITAMLKHEAMERWNIGGEIADFIIDEGGEVMYAETPAPGKAIAGPSYLGEIVVLDKATVDVADQMIMAANERGSVKTVLFFNTIRNCAKDEFDEMTARVTEITRIANDPSFILYDNYLWHVYHPHGDNYSKKYNHNPC